VIYNTSYLPLHPISPRGEWEEGFILFLAPLGPSLRLVLTRCQTSALEPKNEREITEKLPRNKWENLIRLQNISIITILYTAPKTVKKINRKLSSAFTTNGKRQNGCLWYHKLYQLVNLPSKILLPPRPANRDKSGKYPGKSHAISHISLVPPSPPHFAVRKTQCAGKVI
jgi:hypothetical protein